MKHWLAAAAAAPLLIACASAGARTADAAKDTQSAVLIVNGETIALDGGRDAAAAIEQALADSPGSGRVVIEFDAGPDSAFDAAEQAAFAREMAHMAAAMEQAFRGEFDFEFDGDAAAWSRRDGERLHVMMRRAEAETGRHAAHVERQVERLERQAERMAMRIERHAARAELHGLRAGVSGMEDGLESINEVLERGWCYDWSDGARERVALTEERRAELEETRAELRDGLERLRADLAEAEARHPAHREVRIVRRDGETRGFVNGEEVTGSQLDRLLEGAPDAPEPPESPEPPRSPDREER